MIKKILFLLLTCNYLFSKSLSSGDNYYIYENRYYCIIYTQQYKNEAKFIKTNIDEFLKHNDKLFSYSFDEPIKIVLVSNKNQIENAFSTQIPFNTSTYYNGGSGQNNYFSSSSWLSLLFVHEMTHNYQLNAKKSVVIQTMHKYFGNNFKYINRFLPLETLPNIFLPTVILEGNAVLNETLYNFGGRLYNGEFKALNNSLIFANKMTPERFLNNHIEFPYRTEKYIVGGFYMQYLAYKYGVKKVNGFFYEQSIHFINPLMLDQTYKKYFHIGFKQSIYDFVRYTKEQNKGFKQLQSNNILSSSKSAIKFSKIDNKIYYITTNRKTKKELHIYDINNSKLSKQNTTLSNGKIFIKDNILYTNTAGMISNQLYKRGLFDKYKIIDKSTIGKDIQDIKNNHIGYIDTNSSYLKSNLFIDNKFYSNVTSNMLFDKKDNIYYFKRLDNKNVLYKNKTRLYALDSYYTKLIDIVDDEVYFISNSLYGSALYKLSNNNIYRLNDADNIVDGKIIDKNRALVSTITDNSYEVSKIDILNQNLGQIKTPKNVKLEKRYDLNYNIQDTNLSKSQRYNEVSNLEFSSLVTGYGYNSQLGHSYSFDAIFTDPILFNDLKIYTNKKYTYQQTGFSYTNERYTVPFSIQGYYVDNFKSRYRSGFGARFSINYNLIQNSRNVLNLKLRQSIDVINKDKHPSLLTLNYINQNDRYSLGRYDNLSNKAKIYLKYDRQDWLYGFDYRFTTHVYDELYTSLQLKSLNSNSNIYLNENRGVKVLNESLGYDNDNDDTNILIESLNRSLYVQDIQKASIGLVKVVNISRYFFIFPFSLLRESIFYEYNYFKLIAQDEELHEHIFGITFDILAANFKRFPFTMKYIRDEQGIGQVSFELHSIY